MRGIKGKRHVGSWRWGVTDLGERESVGGGGVSSGWGGVEFVDLGRLEECVGRRG